METTVEKTTPRKIIRKQVVKIVPFIGSGENMGLSKYKMVLHEGADWNETLTCLESKTGVRRWLSGLDEFAPEVQNISDPDKKESVIKSIREKVAFIEKSYGANIIDPGDEKFWDKVKSIHPSNHDFWKNIHVKVGNEPVFLDPTIADDLIIISAIEARGFSCVAPSLQDARLSSMSPKFYLDKDIDTTLSQNEVKKLKNKAKAELEKMNDKDTHKMFFVIKNIDSHSHRYKKSTSYEIIYGWLDDYLEGKGSENAKKASEQFIKICGWTREELLIKAVIADASFTKFIQTKSDGKIYHTVTDSMLGGNIEEVYQYLKNPVNAKIWEKLNSDIEALWNE